MRLEKQRQYLYIGDEIVVDCAAGSIMQNGKLCETVPIEAIRECWEAQTEEEVDAMDDVLCRLCGAFDYFVETFHTDSNWQAKFEEFMPIAEKFANLENGLCVQMTEGLDKLRELVNNKFVSYVRAELSDADVLRDPSIPKFYLIRAALSDDLYEAVLRLCGDKRRLESRLLSWTSDPKVMEWMVFCYERKHYSYIYDGWSEFCSAMEEHFDRLKKLGKDFDFPKNWFDAFCNTNHEMQLEKDRERDINLAKNQGAWLDFDLPGNPYIIYVPRNSEAFKDEADQQDNCVYRSYVEEVANGNTNIVCMRERAFPTKSLMTLQVDRRHGIRQCLRSHNNDSRPYRNEHPEAQELYDAYDKYLTNLPEDD